MRCKPLAAVVLLLCPLTAWSGSHCKLIKLAELPVTMSDTRPLLAGTLNGADARFLADSGSFSSMMSRTSATQYGLQLGMLPFGMRVQGVGGSTDAHLGIARDFTLAQLLGRTLHNVQFVVLDDSSAPGLVQGPGAPAAVIGQNLLGLFDTEYDLANGYIRLWEAKGCTNAILTYWRRDEPIALVKLLQTDGRSSLLIGAATLNGVSIHVLFDTGAARSILMRKAAERAGFKADNPGVTAAGLSRGIGRYVAETWIARFDSLDLGGEEIKNARLLVGNIALPEEADMLLGADFFLSHRIFVANSQHKIFFTYNGGRVFDLGAADRATNAASTGPASPPIPAPAVAGTNAPTAGDDGSPADTLEDAAALRRRGAASAGRMEYAAAIADFDAAIRLEPNDAENYLQRAEARVHVQQTAGALSDLDQALRISPDNISALLQRGRLRLITGNDEAARTDFEHAGAVAPNDPGVSLHIAEVYVSSGRFDQAVTLFDSWITAHPSDSRLGAATVGRCWARAATGRELQLALQDCNASVHGRSNSYALQTRGLVWLRLGNYAKAISDYQASLKLQPRNAFARYGLGLAERGKGLRTEGDRDIQAASAQSASVAGLFKRMGFEDP